MVALLPLFVVSAASAVTEPSALTGHKQTYAYSWQQEVQQGADADKEITQQMGLYDNPQVQAYVQAVGQHVLDASTFADPSTPAMYRNTKFTFRVLDTPVVNAFALPGGYVYVTRGLLSHVDNEAQLAVVLGHEIGHVAARHASQQARRSELGKIGLAIGAVLGQAVLGQRIPNFESDVLNTGGQAMQVFMLRYSREAETQADTLGVTYALHAGYAAGDAARFFSALERLSAQEGQGLPTWLSTHPDPGNRAQHVLDLAAAFRNSTNGARILGQEPFLQHIDGLVVGDDPRQGFTQNGVFYHPELRFQMPVAPGWKVDNQPTAVLFSAPNGDAVLGLRLAAANRTHDAASQFVSENNVQVLASGDTAINGLPTTVIVGRATTKDSGQVGVWDAFVEMNGKVFSLLGYAPPQQFDQIRPTFESLAAGFSPLRDPRLAYVQPARLRIVSADHAAPFASYIPTALPPDMTADSVAIMNQVAINETVPKGAALKIPEVAASPAAAAIPAAPAEPAPYPTSSYPPAGIPPYPTSYPPQSYPASTYPPASAPPSTSYPPASSYPPSSSYPQTSYPYPSQPTAPTSTAPAPTYPEPNGTPNNTAPAPTYPPVAPQYPQSSTPYPAQPSYPQATPSYPQFPEPPPTSTTPPSG